MKQFFHNRYIKTVVIFLTGAATLHILLLVLHSCITVNFAKINIFGILGFDLFFPRIGQGLVSFIISAFLIVCLPFTIFLGVTLFRKTHAR